MNFESLALMNGNEILPGATRPSGAYDVVSILSPYRMSCSLLGFYSVGHKSGGLQMGELILYADSITTEEARRIDAYLNYKWFGREPDVWNRPAHVGVLDVAAGATVNVVGNAPIVCSALSGAGTVNGAVELAEGASVEVPVNQDGTITQTLTVSGAVDMSKGGVIRLTGHEKALVSGEYHLIASSAVSGGDWAVNGYTGKRVLTLRKRSDGIWLYVSRRGLNISIR